MEASEDQSLSLSQSLEGKACLVIIYGIPASGKTLLTTKTLRYIRKTQEEQGLLKWNLFAIHFDDFYPPDMRSKIQDKDTSADNPHFYLKKARQLVKSYIEAVLTLNVLGEATAGMNTGGTKPPPLPSPPPPSTPPPSISANLQTEFHRFVEYLKRNCDDPHILDDTGRLRSEQHDSPTIFLLDDTMSLRSMRHEYYQLARRCKIGFAEVCLRCPLPTALLRNSTRSIPIPEPTILAMEQSLEIPEPTRYHWEKRNVVLTSERGEQWIASACEKVEYLIRDALANPVLSIAQADPSIKKSSRLANLNSCIHQADLITRKCVSEVLKDSSHDDKASLAKRANSIRMKLLGEVRRGSVTSGQTIWELDNLNPEQFKKVLLETFHALFEQEDIQ